MKDKTTVAHVPEQVGRTYSVEYFAVHSRRIGDEKSRWGGISRYNTIAEAKAAIASVSQPMDIGGITVSFAHGRELYEYRIAKVVSQCEVVHVETRKI